MIPKLAMCNCLKSKEGLRTVLTAMYDFLHPRNRLGDQRRLRCHLGNVDFLLRIQVSSAGTKYCMASRLNTSGHSVSGSVDGRFVSAKV